LDKDKDNKKTKSFQYSSYSDEEKAEIASIYEMMREQYGFYPNGIDSNDKITWGIILKSDTQMLFEKYGKEYQKRGEEVMEEQGAFAGKFQERKDEMAD
jgi:hypothetical protein